MLSAHELELLAKHMGGAIASQISPVLKRMAELECTIARLEEQLKNAPTPKDGTSVTVDDVKPLITDLVAEVAKSIPVPRDGIDGKSVTVEDVKPLLAEMVSALPVPKDGIDGKSVNLDDVKPLLADMVSEAVKAIPTPKDGTSVTVEDVKPLLAELVAELPVAKDGKSVTVEDVKPLLAEMVSALPVPKDGIDGKSVSIEDVKPLLAELVAELPVAKDGTSVTLDDVKPLLAEMVSAIPVAKDGKDALDLVILPGIDFEKSYLRGTYAKHEGGLWHAHANTQGERGWECVVEGIKAVEVEQQDERTSNIKIALSSGTTVEKTFVLPNMVYRGIYSPDSDYAKGDTLTWGGSLWHVEVDHPTGRPGADEKAFTLVAKRGRDGKDGRNGIDKTATVKI